jgi:AcrR family transcriptional regulator
MPKVVPEYKEEARQRIVQTALLVFAEKGYHETTMEDIAERLGVSEGAIYLYFKSKRELFKAIFPTGRQQSRHIISSSIKSEDPVKAFFYSAVNVYEQYEPISGLLLELLAEASRDASLKKIFRDDYDEDCEALRRFLEQLRKRSLIGANIDAHSISVGIVALFYGYAVSRVLGIRKDDAKRAHTEAMRAMLNGTLRRSTGFARSLTAES